MLTGLALALGLLLAVQISQNIRPQNSPEQISSPATEINQDLNAVIEPVVFMSISEQNDQLRLTGTSEANATVSIEDHGRNIIDVVADKDGNWSGTIPVTNRDNMIVDLVIYQETGAKIRSDEKIYRIPAPEDITDETLPQALLMLTAQGRSSRIIRSPFRGLPTSDGLSLETIDYDDRGGVIISGMSETPGLIQIFANETRVGDTPVLSNGRWYFIAADTLPTGSYDIRADLINNNESAASLTVSFERMRAEAVSGEVVNVDFQPFNWQVRRGLLGGGYQYTAVFAPLKTVIQ